MKELLKKVELEISKRNLSSEIISEALLNNETIASRRIIFGYASVDVIDREGQRIPIPALKNAVERFMQNTFFRIITIFHSDISVGRVLPQWTHPKSGKVYKTLVDQTGWQVVCEIRTDIDVANKVWDEILKGNLRSFSIAGSSKDKLQKRENGVEFEQIKELDLYEICICEVPVNPMSKFDLLWNPERVSV